MIIQQAIWLYVRFTLSFRDVEDLLAERGIAVSYETVRRWVNHFGPRIATDLRKRRPKPHTIWHLDEVYLKIDGRLVSNSPLDCCAIGRDFLQLREERIFQGRAGFLLAYVNPSAPEMLASSLGAGFPDQPLAPAG